MKIGNIEVVIVPDSIVARMQRWLKAWEALHHGRKHWSYEDVNLRFDVESDGLHLRVAGLDWIGQTTEECAQQADDWMRSTSAERVREKREALDKAMKVHAAVEAIMVAS